jgi:phosphate/sulfate permease
LKISCIFEEKESETRQPLIEINHSLNRDEDSPKKSNKDKDKDMEEKTRELVFKTFRILMLIAAMMVCLGHGANDVANSISPLVIVL